MSGPAPTMTATPPVEGPPLGDPSVPGDESVDRPIRRRRASVEQLVEFFGSLLASFAIVWLGFRIAGVSGVVGFALLWIALFFTLYAIVNWRNHGLLAMKDRVATVAVWTGGALAMLPLVAVIGYVILKGFSVAMADFPHFWTADMSGLTASAPVTSVGAGAAIVGTLEQVAIAAVLTVPLGILAATYLADSNNIFSRTVAAVVDAMTGAPAIIAGLVVYLFWVVPRGTSGKSGFAAGLALAVMMLPIVTRAALEVVRIVPGSLREAALALGAPQWRVLVRIVLPTARAGLMTAVILGVARIAGETAPILFNAGGNKDYNFNPFSGQQDNLPLRIYELVSQPNATAVRIAWGVSFVLVVVVLLLFIIARLVGSSKPGKRRLRLPRIPRLRRFPS
jgi:phosphate transport system permease protein